MRHEGNRGWLASCDSWLEIWKEDIIDYLFVLLPGLLQGVKKRVKLQSKLKSGRNLKDVTSECKRRADHVCYM